MATIINAVSGTGLTQTSDGSGVLKVQSNGVTTNALAWVNFNGTSVTPITPRANYNISSVTKNGTGDYTLNFTNAMSDVNYATTVYAYSTGANNLLMSRTGYAPSTTSFRLNIYNTTPGLSDVEFINAAIFGN